LLGKKPKIYETNDFSLGTGGLNGAGTGLNLSGPGSLMDGPRLDLTSTMINQQQQQTSQSSMPGDESSMQLPRPCKFTTPILSLHTCVHMFETY